MERVKKGDTVQVISGKDKGRRGKVLRVFPEEGRVLVEGIQVVKRHQRRTQQSQGGIIDKILPLYASKLLPICPHCGKPTRVRFRGANGEPRRRRCVECDKVMDKV